MNKISRQSIDLAGIIRNLPVGNVKDGSMHELINLRPKDGALRPVGAKDDTTKANGAIRHVHIISDTTKVYIANAGGYLKYWVYVYDTELKSVTSSLVWSLDMAFASMHNTLLVSDRTNELTYVLVYSLDTNTYEIFSDLLADMPSIRLYGETVSADNDTARASYPDSLSQHEVMLGEYNKLKNSKADKGYLTGSILVRFAWELMDGSLVRHTLPDFIYASKITSSATWTENLLGADADGWDVSSVFYAAAVNFKLLCSSGTLSALQSKYANIIRGLKVYVTNPISPGEEEIGIYGYYGNIQGNKVVNPRPEMMDSMEMTGKTSYWEWLTSGFKYNTKNVDFGTISERNPLSDTLSYFLLKEYKLNELVANTFTRITNKTVNDLTTREPMSVNNLSFHKVFGKRLFAYNERFFLGSIKNTMFPGFNVDGWIQNPSSSVTDVAFEVGIEFDIKISNRQTLTVFSGWSDSYNQYETATSKIWFYLNYKSLDILQKPSYWGYPDARATKARVLVKIGSDIKLAVEKTLESYPALNFSITDGIEVKATFASMTTATLTEGKNFYYDYNRIQACEINNPFFFPPENSYRVSNGEVLGLSTNAIALSQGQFGQYPIFAFTTEGIWALNIGKGLNLIDSLIPISREVCSNPDCILGIDGATVFPTDRGLFIIAGTQAAEISESAEGDYLSPASGSGAYSEALNNVNRYQIIEYLCPSSFLTYLNAANIAWDHKNSELILSNSSFVYSWVYSVKFKTWFKISQVWDSFYNDFPKAYGNKSVSGTYHQYDMTEEVFTDAITVHAETRPMKISQSDYKLINRLKVLGEVSCGDNDTFSINLFGSVDGHNWYQLSSSSPVTNYKDMLIGRSQFSCKYYILLVGGKVSQSSHFIRIEIDFTERYGNKIR